MTKQSVITASEARFPLDKLTLSPLNPRQVVTEAEITDLANSIRDTGLIQPIAGLQADDGTVEIVAGGRRLRALQHLARTEPDLVAEQPALANPMVMLAPDAATADVWANTENVARADLHPAEEIIAYGKMQQNGASVAGIARVFAVSEKHVYRRLALAGLPGAVIDALRAGEISLSNAATFTLSNDARRILEVLDTIRGGDCSDHRLRQMLVSEAVRETDRRVIYVTEAGYDEAEGAKRTDLFSEAVYFEDVDLLDALFDAKLAEDAEALAQAGWKWVETVRDPWLDSWSMGLHSLARVYPVEGVLPEADAVRYEELGDRLDANGLTAQEETELARLDAILAGDFTDAQRAHAGVYLYVNQQGIPTTTAGIIRKEDTAAAVEAGIVQKSLSQGQGSDKPKSPISAKLKADLDNIAQGARQHAILADPDLLLDLLAYQLAHDLNWNSPLALTTTEVGNQPSTEADGFDLDPRLTDNPARDMWGVKDVAASFRAFRKKGSGHVRGELTRFLAAQYQGGNAKLEALVDKETQPDIRAVWTPTAANFFSRVGAPYLLELWRDLLDLAEDHPTATTFAKLKKRDKARKLEDLFAGGDMRTAHNVTEAQAARIDTWLPEGMA